MLDGMEKKADPEWDNPFIPGGELSREADEIVNLIKSGRPITPTGEPKQIVTTTTTNGNTIQQQNHHHNNNNNNNNSNNKNAQNNDNAAAATTKKITQTQSSSSSAAGQPKITVNGSDKNGAATKQGHVSKQTIPGPTSASHVVIDDKKNKNSGCCVVQ